MPTEELYVQDILDQFPDAQPLGKGGQKVVLAIHHPTFGLSVLKIGFYSSPQGLERIQREVAVLSDLRSPYFPGHFTFALVEPNRYYILEEYLEGPTLDACFPDFANEGAASRLGTHLLDALTILWQKRIVHRDLKPENIIIGTDHPRIIDLGIARLLDAESLTQTYAPYGPCTPYYASPEQLENRKRDIDPRTDQFALGIVLCQALLQDQHPFSPELVGGDSIPENILRGQWARERLGASASGAMYDLVTKLLGREPYMRFRRPEDLRSALAVFAGART